MYGFDYVGQKLLFYFVDFFSKARTKKSEPFTVESRLLPFSVT